MTSVYDLHLTQNAANFQPLTPLTYLRRAALVFPNTIAYVHGKQRVDYREFYARCRRFASALTQKGIGKNDTVSVILPNVPAMLEAHYGIPMAGAVLHSINTRLDAAIIAFQLDHAESKILITDREFAPVVKQALEICSVKPIVIDYDDLEFPQTGEKLGNIDYEEFIQSGDKDFDWVMPENEWDAISLNYTSGTTGNPKGVVYHHRGAALLAQGNIITGSIQRHAVYLWTLPMFHCNGWCFTWSMSVVAGTHICLRAVRQKPIWDALADEKVSHMCGAPIVMSTILNTDEAEKRDFDHQVEFFTAAAPPPESVLAAMGQAGFNVTHLYGLTETYGPAVVNEWKGEWSDLPSDDRAKMKARQGVAYISLDDLTVREPNTLVELPWDGESLGEVMFRGNIVMKGYLKNKEASEDAFKGGWFHSGDLGVRHADGYIQLKDRSKDIIISGGENISSIEVEDVLYKHPAVSACGVVAKPDDKWGETPCAFIELKAGAVVSEAEIIAHCQNYLAKFKCPRHVVFCEVPKTSTGKIQKYVLRDMAK